MSSKFSEVETPPNASSIDRDDHQQSVSDSHNNRCVNTGQIRTESWRSIIKNHRWLSLVELDASRAGSVWIGLFAVPEREGDPRGMCVLQSGTNGPTVFECASGR